MEGTCSYKDCKIYKKLKLKSPDECPNYVESWWAEDGKDPKLIRDCLPKRLLLMMQDFHERMIGMQSDIEKMRNEAIWSQAASIVKNNVDIQKFVEARSEIINKLKDAESIELLEEQNN
jgi:hypothetical protein